MPPLWAFLGQWGASSEARLGLPSAPSHPTAEDNLEGKVGVAPAASQGQNESLLPNPLHDEDYSHPEIPRETIRNPEENGE